MLFIILVSLFFLFLKARKGEKSRQDLKKCVRMVAVVDLWRAPPP